MGSFSSGTTRGFQSESINPSHTHTHTQLFCCFSFPSFLLTPLGCFLWLVLCVVEACLVSFFLSFVPCTGWNAALLFSGVHFTLSVLFLLVPATLPCLFFVLFCLFLIMLVTW